MRVLILALFVWGLSYLPVYAFEHMVLPQLEGIQAQYAAAEHIADSVSDTAN